MSLDSFQYLVEVYWPFLVAAGLVGLATGWFSTTGKDRAR
jgi:hypothetical protein